MTGGTAQDPTYLTTPYFSTGGVPGRITLTFAQQQSYLGLLWGAIGVGDYIDLLDQSGDVIAQVTGTQAIDSAAGFNGTQGFGCSQYTLINPRSRFS